MRVPRLTIRRLMAAVAVAGVAVGWHVLEWRRSYFLREAALCTSTERHYLEAAVQSEAEIGPEWEELASKQLALAEHFARSHKRYERAARHPWLTVAPDVPEPK